MEYALACQAKSPLPVFVTGGVNDETITDLVHQGLRHFVVVRHLTESSDPERSARALRTAFDEALFSIPVEPAQ